MGSWDSDFQHKEIYNRNIVIITGAFFQETPLDQQNVCVYCTHTMSVATMQTTHRFSQSQSLLKAPTSTFTFKTLF